MLTSLQVSLLRRLFRSGPMGGGAYSAASKLSRCLGQDFLEAITGKMVIDFGCGEGAEAIELARHGAARVIGIDVRDEMLCLARQNARAARVESTCVFTKHTDQRADVIICLDAFEHFADSIGVLAEMDRLLKPGGEVFASFGPTWLHPMGGHLFSVFPWAHLILSETALLTWRSDFKTDGAKRFGEVAGGLNQMTIGKFERIVRESPFEFACLQLVPIRKLRWLHNRVTREFTTAIVRCTLRRKAAPDQLAETMEYSIRN